MGGSSVVISNIIFLIGKMEKGMNIFLTGANRGLGKQLVQLLHQKHPQVAIHISSRSPPQQLANQWKSDIPHHNFHTYQIDLLDSQSIARSVELIRQKQIRFDVIVANAAYGADYGQTIPSEETARNTIATNVISTIDFIKQFIPLLQPHGRVVVVSSIMGALTYQPKQLVQKVTNPSITEKEIIDISNHYIESAIKKNMGHYSWSAYCTSKALINSWSRFILPTYLKEGQTSICLHPGWCQTDMGGQSAPLTSRRGAQLINNGIWIQKVDHTKFYNEKFCDYYTCA